MGNKNESEEFDPFAIWMEDLKSIGFHKNGLGHLQVFFHSPSKKRYFEKIITFDNQKRKLELKWAIELIQSNPQINYLQIARVQIDNNSVFCTVWSFKVITDSFDATVQDLLNQWFKFEEWNIWSLLIGVMEVLKWEDFHKTKNEFLHAISICYHNDENKFSLIHNKMFEETNYNQALGNQLHFCSPELFC